MRATETPYSARQKESGWGPMLVLSFLFHVAVVCVFLFVPDSFPARRPYPGVVYQVDLVELPSRGGTKAKHSGEKAALDRKVLKSVPKNTPAKRIDRPVKKKKPLVIAKRTVHKKTTRRRKKTPPSKILEKAISRIERKVKSENTDPVNRAISEIEKRVGREEQGGAAGRGSSPVGIPMRLYEMEVETLIKSHWAYPVALEESRTLEATIVLRVKADGTVLDTKFLKPSGNHIFDQSVLKAIERSEPLPPFPETYRKSYEDFEIHFDLKELDNF
ncbi:MAG: TonB family protein [Deltaproteobacteria bacterium]|nr:TonB family protein [Deltaproteobacteria bacterium]MBW2129887.1 TonB family protein [Deltaproteobacteria bacterium]MBW2304975.1 TonB family protein [Deltaproteobacteria bacterium]